MTLTGRARRLARSVRACALLITLVIGSVYAPPPERASPTPSPSADIAREAEYWIDQVGVVDAWGTTRGAGETIAVIDTGIGEGPEGFDGVIAGADFSGVGSADGRKPVGTRDREHGSLVASVAAARPGASRTAMIGVAPEADLLSISVGFPDSASTIPFTDQIAEAMRWAVDHGADVINLSFTTNTLGWSESWDDAFLYAYDHDVVVVVAAGNRGSGTDVVGAPATIPGVLAVAGVDRKGVASEEASTQGVTIGVSAPSEDMVGMTSDGRVVGWEGTSAAAPIVSGIVALVRAAHPDLSAGEVIDRILRTADAGVLDSTPDPIYGYGVVDAAAAVAADVPVDSTHPQKALTEWVRLHRRAPTVATPEPEQTRESVAPLAPPNASQEPSFSVLPNRTTVIYGSIPLIALTVPVIVIALGVSLMILRIRVHRSRRPRSRPRP